MKSKDDLKIEVTQLVAEAHGIFLQELNKEQPGEFKKLKIEEEPLKGPIHQRYRNWYSKCITILRGLMPERLHEFTSCYEPDPKRKETDWLNYTIKDYLLGLVVTRGYQRERVFEPFGSFSAKMQHQITILTALRDTLDSRIVDVESALQAKLFDSEVDTAEELAKRGHLRAAGAVAGVVLEAHLNRFAIGKAVKIGKKNPTISDVNEALKGAGVLDIPTWRHIQRLGDLRNLSVHSKERTPTEPKIVDLIAGVRKFLAELN